MVFCDYKRIKNKMRSFKQALVTVSHDNKKHHRRQSFKRQSHIMEIHPRPTHALLLFAFYYSEHRESQGTKVTQKIQICLLLFAKNIMHSVMKACHSVHWTIHIIERLIFVQCFTILKLQWFLDIGKIGK